MSFKKKTNIIFITVFLLLSILVGAFNCIVDPYGIRQIKANNFNIYHSPREMVYTYINKTKDIKFDSVVIGGSSTGMVFFPSIFYRDTKENLAALQIEGIAPREMHKMLEYFLSLHPEIKKAYVSVEPMQYLRCAPFSSIPEKPTNFIQDFITLYYSQKATLLSIQNIKNRFIKIEDNSDIAFKANPEMKCNYDVCEPEHYKYMKLIDDLLLSKNIQRTYFVLPMHSLFLADLYNKDELKYLENFKQELAKISPFYDMAYVNKYTKDQFEWLWADILHMSPLLSPYIFEMLVYGQKYPEFSQIITAENIDEKLNEQKELIIQYMQTDKEYVDKYINSTFDITKNAGYGIKRYWKDMPEPYKTRFFTEYDVYYKNR